MRPRVCSEIADADLEPLRRFTVAVITFLSARMMDPHRYFEQKYMATLDGAESSNELRAVIEGLLDWTASSGLDEIAIAELNEELATEALPSFSLMVSSGGWMVGSVLARGHIRSDDEYARVIDLLGDPDAGTAQDLHLAARLRDCYAAKGH